MWCAEFFVEEKHTSQKGLLERKSMGRRPNDYWGKLGEPTRGHDYWGKLKTDAKIKGMAGRGCRFVLEVVHL